MTSISMIRSTCLVASLVFGAVAQADLVDPENRASLEITSAPASVAGFTTYSFSVSPLQPLTEISSIDATFTSTAMRQVNPVVGPTTFSSIFADNNALFFLAGEDPTGLSDSQFEFLRTGVTVVPMTDSESSTELAAAFTGFAPITTDQTIAHVVLPNGDTGTLDLNLAVRPLGGGTPLPAIFSSIAFGGAVAIPEPSQLLLGSMLASVGILRANRRRSV